MNSRTLAGNLESLHNAAAWLREYLDVHPQDTIFDQFEEYFNCQLVVEHRQDPWYCPDKAIFNTEQDLTAFLLRWA